ncbi:MAG: helix-turn-helix domain-containing protein [Propionicimonas sp.]|uniref:winged helix-turn-helix domain-containing protein n=1 Tax=Propionicimonas sp. TaxID=1955623 RepID=UPI003D129391
MADGKSGEARRTPISPEKLKAFTHPLRLRLYEELQRRESATASQLARIIGESSGQTSYHLRQLERHGFVEDDPAHSGGRERWWRPVGFVLSDPDLADPDTGPIAELMIRNAIAERAAALTSWLDHLDPTSADDQGALTRANLRLTAQEADALAAELSEVLERHSAAVRGRTPPPGAGRYEVHVDVFPLAVPEEPAG